MSLTPSKESSENFYGVDTIAISDGIGMLKSKIGPNERPFISQTKDCNNTFVESFEKNLRKDVKGERIKVVDFATRWDLFSEGTAVAELIKVMDTMHRYDDAYLQKYYILFKNSSIAELHAMTSFVVGTIWDAIGKEMKFRFAKLKWENVFKHDQKDWLALRNKHANIFAGTDLSLVAPFASLEDLNLISEKISSITSTPIKV